MSFGYNPVEEEPHDECRHEIERLQAELDESHKLLGDCAFHIRHLSEILDDDPLRVKARAMDFVYGVTDDTQSIQAALHSEVA